MHEHSTRRRHHRRRRQGGAVNIRPSAKRSFSSGQPADVRATNHRPYDKVAEVSR